MRLRASVAQALKRLELGRQPFRRLGEGRLFESLREWVPGDDLRHIDWKATARRRKVITRQYEAERRQQLLLVVDTGRLMTAEIASTARLDYAVRAALELAYAAAQHDDNVGVMAFADGVKHYVAPQRGRVGLKRVLDVLAVLEPVLVEPDYPGAFRYLAARGRKRALTVLFTDVIDRFASDALVANVASLRPRHLPLAVTLRNPELDRVAASRPETPPDAFRKAAAEELLRARDDTLATARAWQVVGTGDSVEITNVSFVWASGNSAVATVDPNGHIVGIKSGTTTIRAAAANFDKRSQSGEITLRVSERLEIDSIRPPKVHFGDTITVYGVGVDSIFQAQLGQGILIPNVFRRSRDANGYARSVYWVPPPARRDSLFYIGNGVFGFSKDPVRVIQQDLYQTAFPPPAAPPAI